MKKNIEKIDKINKSKKKIIIDDINDLNQIQEDLKKNKKILEENKNKKIESFKEIQDKINKQHTIQKDLGDKIEKIREKQIYRNDKSGSIRKIYRNIFSNSDETLQTKLDNFNDLHKSIVNGTSVVDEKLKRQKITEEHQKKIENKEKEIKNVDGDIKKESRLVRAAKASGQAGKLVYDKFNNLSKTKKALIVALIIIMIANPAAPFLVLGSVAAAAVTVGSVGAVASTGTAGVAAIEGVTIGVGATAATAYGAHKIGKEGRNKVADGLSTAASGVGSLGTATASGLRTAASGVGSLGTATASGLGQGLSTAASGVGSLGTATASGVEKGLRTTVRAPSRLYNWMMGTTAIEDKKKGRKVVGLYNRLRLNNNYKTNCNLNFNHEFNGLSREKQNEINKLVEEFTNFNSFEKKIKKEIYTLYYLPENELDKIIKCIERQESEKANAMNAIGADETTNAAFSQDTLNPAELITDQPFSEGGQEGQTAIMGSDMQSIPNLSGGTTTPTTPKTPQLEKNNKVTVELLKTLEESNNLLDNNIIKLKNDIEIKLTELKESQTNTDILENDINGLKNILSNNKNITIDNITEFNNIIRKIKENYPELTTDLKIITTSEQLKKTSGRKLLSESNAKKTKKSSLKDIKEEKIKNRNLLLKEFNNDLNKFYEQLLQLHDFRFPNNLKTANIIYNDLQKLIKEYTKISSKQQKENQKILRKNNEQILKIIYQIQQNINKLIEIKNNELISNKEDIDTILTKIKNNYLNIINQNGTENFIEELNEKFSITSENIIVRLKEIYEFYVDNYIESNNVAYDEKLSNILEKLTLLYEQYIIIEFEKINDIYNTKLQEKLNFEQKEANAKQEKAEEELNRLKQQARDLKSKAKEDLEKQDKEKKEQIRQRQSIADELATLILQIK